MVGIRISKWMEDNSDRDEYILLTADHPFTKLYMRKVPYIPDYKTRLFAKFKASKSKGRLIHRE